MLVLAGASLLILGGVIGRWPRAGALMACAGTALVAWKLGLKLYGSWPMLVAYQEPLWCSLWAGVVASAQLWRGQRGLGRGVALLAGGVGCAAGLMPGDFYLPMLRSGTLWAHAYVVLQTAGMGSMLVGAVAAGQWLAGWQQRQGFALWVGWAVVLYTLGVFCAQVWGYLGWGTTVVWEEEGVVGAMALWFYYAALVHMHLCGGFGIRARAWFAAWGGVMVGLLRLWPALGPVQMPGGW